VLLATSTREDPILSRRSDSNGALQWSAGQTATVLLVEYGPNVLDLSLRFRVHALEQQLREMSLPGSLMSRRACGRCISTTILAWLERLC